jgi:hypothetical protein
LKSEDLAVSRCTIVRPAWFALSHSVAANREVGLKRLLAFKNANDSINRINLMTQIGVKLYLHQ